MFNNKFGNGILKHPGYNGPAAAVLPTVAAGVSIASGVSSMMGGGGGGNVAGGGYYDPFAGERSKYFSKLEDLTGMGKNGAKDSLNTVYNSPLYMGGLAEGERSLGRGLAARGLTESGAENLAYKSYGQDYFTKQYQNLYNQYAGLSGATNAPLDMSNVNALNANRTQQGFNNIAGGLGGLNSIFNSSSSGGGNASPGIQLGGYNNNAYIAPSWGSSATQMPSSWASIGEV